MFVIKWRLHGSEATHTSDNVFDEERAEELVALANKHFERAFHWAEELRGERK